MDPIAVVEATYQLGADFDAWLRGVVCAARPVFESDSGRGAIALLVDAPRSTPDHAHILAMSSDSLPEDASDVLSAVVRIGARAESVARIRARGAVSTLSQSMGELFFAPGGFAEALEPFSVKDSSFVLAGDPLGVCCILASAYPALHRMSIRESTTWQLIAAHVATGFRLRQRVAGERDPGREVEAVLDVSGKVHHAEGLAAASPGHREALRRAALDIASARGKARAEDPLQALRMWQALVSGRWSLVDRFDSDGRRFIVARRNEPRARRHPALTVREAQVATLAALGHTSKVIAYELGISLSSVATLLRRTLRKLNLESRRELVELFAPSLP